MTYAIATAAGWTLPAFALWAGAMLYAGWRLER